MIWVLRDPVDVFFSNVKMWKAMIQMYSLWELDPKVLDTQLSTFLAAALRFSSQALIDATTQLPQTQLAVIRYDDLIDRPAEVLASINNRLNIQSGDIDEAALHQTISQAASFSRADYAGRSIPHELQSIREMLLESYRAAWSSHGI